MGNPPKKQRVLYRQDETAKAAELEAFLFGAKDTANLFERKEEDEEPFNLDNLLDKEGSHLFFEDRGAATVDYSDLADEDESNSEDEAPEEVSTRPQHLKQAQSKQDKPLQPVQLHTQHLRLGSDSDSDEQASESENELQGTGEHVQQVQEKNEQQQPSSHSESGDEEDAEEQHLQQHQQRAERAQSGKTAGPSSRRAPAWQDSSDQNLHVDVASKSQLRKLRTSEKQKVMSGAQYEAALRKQHAAMHGRTTWAKLDVGTANRIKAGAGASDEDTATEESLLQRAGGLLAHGIQRQLPPGTIETTRLKDANQHEPSNAVVQSVQFHPNGQLLMTAGLDKKLRIFQVDGVRNPKVQSVHFDDMPLHAAHFTSAGSQVVCAGRRPFFYVYDMESSRIERVLGPGGGQLKSLETFVASPCSASSEPLLAFAGDQGQIPLYSLKSRQCVATLKMNGSVRTLAFTSDGTELLTSGSDGRVNIWDLRTRRCRYQFIDMGNVGASAATALAVSADNKYIATGAGSGVVNVYRRSHLEAAVSGSLAGAVAVPPIKELMNLTTGIDTLTFSSDAQILAIGSRMKKDALRLVHLPSCTVFSNWPTSRSPLHYVHCADFSPHGGFMAIGNAKGRVLLYRLHHYPQA